MKEMTLDIEGMSCQHCIMRVKKAIDALNGILSSEVTLGKAVVKFDDSNIKEQDIRSAIEKAGYKIK